MLLKLSPSGCYICTIYIKNFKGQNFQGFCRFWYLLVCKYLRKQPVSLSHACVFKNGITSGTTEYFKPTKTLTTSMLPLPKQDPFRNYAIVFHRDIEIYHSRVLDTGSGINGSRMPWKKIHRYPHNRCRQSPSVKTSCATMIM